jgi:hypothetical protein
LFSIATREASFKLICCIKPVIVVIASSWLKI